MHMVTAKIALGGDIGNVMWRQADNPVSWPEVGVIQYTHGEESVFDVEVCDEVDATRIGEKQRLAEIYGKDIVELVYPGRAPILEMEMPGVTGVPPRKKATAPVKVDPEQPAASRHAPQPGKRVRPIPEGIQSFDPEKDV